MLSACGDKRQEANSSTVVHDTVYVNDTVYMERTTLEQTSDNDEVLNNDNDSDGPEEYRVELEKQETVEQSLALLDEKVKDVYEVLDHLAEEVGNDDFEYACLASNNTETRLDVQIAQLKVNIYKELFEATKSEDHKNRLNKAKSELQKIHKNSYLAD